ncbi:hypothetical protein LINGRAHAP2_LOCUS7452, partial [Linum grandiflorum]
HEVGQPLLASFLSSLLDHHLTQDQNISSNFKQAHQRGKPSFTIPKGL